MDEQVWCRIAAALPNDLITGQLCEDLHDAEEDWRKVTRDLEWERREWPKQIAFALGLSSIVERTPSMVAMRVDALRAENSRLAARVADLEGLLREIEQHYAATNYDAKWLSAPGHAHAIPGRWDVDGSECRWCETWGRVLAALAGKEVKP